MTFKFADMRMLYVADLHHTSTESKNLQKGSNVLKIAIKNIKEIQANLYMKYWNNWKLQNLCLLV